MTKKRVSEEGERPIRGFRAYDSEWAEIQELARGRGLTPATFLRQLAREEAERVRKAAEKKKP